MSMKLNGIKLSKYFEGIVLNILDEVKRFGVIDIIYDADNYIVTINDKFPRFALRHNLRGIFELNDNHLTLSHHNTIINRRHLLEYDKDQKILDAFV